MAAFPASSRAAASGRRRVLFSVAVLAGLLGFAGAAPASTTSALAYIGNWNQLPLQASTGTGRRDMCFAYDPLHDRIIHIAGGRTFALTFGLQPAWVDLGIPAPPEGDERGFYDPFGQRIVIVTSTMDVYALSMVNPTGWQGITVAGTRPPARRFFAAAHDTQRNRVIIHGGGFAEYNDVWALTLSGLPTWSQLSPSGTAPPNTMGPAAAYDPARDRVIIVGGSASGYSGTSDTWSLSLADPVSWQKLSPAGGVPTRRMLASLVFDPSSDRLLLCDGYGDGARDDLWEFDLADQGTWTALLPTGPRPSPRWSHAAAYRAAAPSMVLYGGLDGSYLYDAWSIELPPADQLPHVLGFQPPGGRVGDLVTVLGSNLAPATSVTLAGMPVVVESASASLLTFHVPAGATTGRIVVTTPLGTAESAADFQVGNEPVIFSASPDSGQYGDSLYLHGARFTGATSVILGGSGLAPFSVLDDATIALTVDSLASTGPITVTTVVATGTSPFPFHRLQPIILSADADSGRIGDHFRVFGRNLIGTTKVAIGGTGSAGFTVLSDSTMEIVIDALATAGPIHVSEPGRTSTTSFSFLKLPNDPRPHVLAVRDVAADQGGKVVVAWRASDIDHPYYHSITGYRVWRRANIQPAAAKARPDLLVRTVPGADGALVETYWESIADLPAAFLRGYAYSATMLRDSLPGDNPYTAFFVQALTADKYTFYNSNVDSGYSVDNLAPPTPSPFAVVYGTSENALHWQLRRTPDLREFRIYRSTGQDFELAPENLAGTTADTSYTDIAGQFYYKLVAVDVHGNPSRVAFASPDRPVSTLASLVDAASLADRVRLTWFSGGNAGMAATVYRRTQTTGWVAVASIVSNGEGYLRYEDTDVETGVRYGYRLGILEPDAGEIFAGEAWVTMETPRFALAGVHPNPCSGVNASVAFVLAGAEPARLELFDLGGRRLESRELGSMGPGRHSVQLSQGRRLSPGLYFVRLTSAGQSQGARFAVVE